VFRRVDLLGFGQRPVVKPQDYVAVIAVVREVRAGDRNRFVRVVGEDRQRAGRIEAQPLDTVGVDLGFGNDLL
jgi:hypothetical protein